LADDGFGQYEYIVASEFPNALVTTIGLSVALILCALIDLDIAYRLLIIFNGSIWLIDHFIINKKVKWLQIDIKKSKK